MGFRYEADFQKWFGRWLRSGEGRMWMKAERICAGAFELKLASGSSCALSSIRQHQWVELARADGFGGKVFGVDVSDGMYHKISDSAVGYKPLDCVYMGLGDGCVGYLVIGYRNGEKIALMRFKDVWRVVGEKAEKKTRGGIGLKDAERMEICGKARILSQGNWK